MEWAFPLPRSGAAARGRGAGAARVLRPSRPRWPRAATAPSSGGRGGLLLPAAALVLLSEQRRIVKQHGLGFENNSSSLHLSWKTHSCETLDDGQ